MTVGAVIFTLAAAVQADAPDTPPIVSDPSPVKVVDALPIPNNGHVYYGHPCGQPIILYLDRPLPNGATITGQWVSDTSGKTPVPVPGKSVILPGNKVVAFVPTGNSFKAWGEDEDTPPPFRIDFTPENTGLANLAPYHASFTTSTAKASADCGPWVISTSPQESFIDVGFDTDITVRWSDALDPATVIPANVRLVPDGGEPAACSLDFDYGKDFNRLRIVPTKPMVPATRYTVTLGTGFRNLTGKPHAQPVSWSFTTRPLRSVPIPGAGPYVVAVSPPDFSFNIPAPASISIVFSEDMDPATLTAENIHLDEGNSWDVATSLKYTAATRTLLLVTAVPFPPATYHKLTLDLAHIFSLATETSGKRKAMQANGTFVFSTESSREKLRRSEGQ